MPLVDSRFRRNRMDYLSSTYSNFSEFLLHYLCQSCYSAPHPLETQSESAATIRHWHPFQVETSLCLALSWWSWRESNPRPKHILTLTLFTQQPILLRGNLQTTTLFDSRDNEWRCKDLHPLHHLLFMEVRNRLLSYFRSVSSPNSRFKLKSHNAIKQLLSEREVLQARDEVLQRYCRLFFKFCTLRRLLSCEVKYFLCPVETISAPNKQFLLSLY